MVVFYLFVLLLPIQIGLHFFPSFSHLNGVPIDYLAPTIYFTDILAGIVIAGGVISGVKKNKGIIRWMSVSLKKKEYVFLLSFLVFLLLTSVNAANVGAALYRFVKVIEFIALGWAIVGLHPNFRTVTTLLGIGVLYESLIALGQFFLGRSIGMGLWWLGERTFYAETPGIATFSWGGEMFLRPYATFPHPNVLGGFLAVGMIALLWTLLEHKKTIKKELKILYWGAISIGICVLVLTVSRAAWIVFILGVLGVVLFHMKKALIPRVFKSFFQLFPITVIASLLIPFLFPAIVSLGGSHWMERVTLLGAAVKMSVLYPLMGVGLNNFIVSLPFFLNSASSFSLFQPVHSVYFLWLSETGIIGLCLGVVGVYVLYKKSLHAPTLISFLFLMLLSLGMFDHYIATLQQGQLLATLVVSFLFIHKTS